MKRYKIVKTVLLSFCSPQDDYDLFIDPAGDVFLEANEHTVWLLKDDNRYETNNTLSYLNFLLERKSIEEVEV